MRLYSLTSDAAEEDNLNEGDEGVDTVLGHNVEFGEPVIQEEVIVNWVLRSISGCRYEHSTPDPHTRNLRLSVWHRNCPVYQAHNEWEYQNSSIEDAKHGSIMGVGMLAGRRQQLLEASRGRRNLASMVRVVEMHEGPGLC